MREFKIGDIVVSNALLPRGRYGITNSRMLEARVIRLLNGGIIEIEVIKHCNPIYNKSTFIVDSEYFKKLNQGAENVETCEVCGIELNDAEGTLIDNDLVCDECLVEHYTICEHCGELTLIESATEVNCNHLVCEGCLGNYERCERCEGFFDSNVLYEHNDDLYCEDCYNLIRAESAIIGYCHTTDVRFWGDNSNRYYGIELEVDDGDNRNETAIQVKELLPRDYIICKDDSSLTNGGFELVTEPATFMKHGEFKNDYMTAMDILKDNGFRSHDTDTCGLHIHVNKSSFDDWELATAKMIIYLNLHWDKIVKFSRRNYNNLRDWADKNEIMEAVNVDDTENTLKIKCLYNTDRYRAINITNYATIEFRFFKGSLNFNTVAASLEFVKNLCEFAENATLEEVLESEFTTPFLSTSQNFNDYLIERGIL